MAYTVYLYEIPIIHIGLMSVREAANRWCEMTSNQFGSQHPYAR